MKRKPKTDDFPWDAPIVVVRSEPVPEVPVEWMRDRTLSLGARGLLAETMAYGGEWDVTPEDLAEIEPGDSVETIRGYVAELVDHGYMQIT